MQSETDSQSSHHKPFSYRYLILAFITCLLMLIFAHHVTLTIYHHIWFPSSYHELRNPFFMRGWEQYTALPDTSPVSDPYLVIVISNSQGFLQEDADDTQAYAHQLQILLQQQSARPIKVLNWAVVAGNAAEQIILAARAISHNPDIILWITSDANMTRAQFRSLDYYSTDITRLAYNSSVRQYLSSEFLTIHNGYDPLSWLKINTGVGKLLHIFEKERFFVWWFTFNVKPFGMHIHEWDAEAEYYVKEFYETVNRGESQIPIIFVGMPLNVKHYSDEEWAEMILFSERVNAIYSTLDNIQVYDATQIIPQKSFYTHAHMRPEGHKQFAEWLYRQIFANRY
jgi:hypothetical protein